MYQYYIDRVIKGGLLGSWGNSWSKGGDCDSALQGVKRDGMYPLSVYSLSSILVSLFNVLTRFV